MAPERKRFREVPPPDFCCSIEVRQSPRNLENTMESTGREPQAFAGITHQFCALRVKCGDLIEYGGGRGGVGPHPGKPEGFIARSLPRPLSAIAILGATLILVSSVMALGWPETNIPSSVAFALTLLSNLVIGLWLLVRGDRPSQAKALAQRA